MIFYVITYKDEPIEFEDTEYNARTNYKLNRVDLRPDMHLFEYVLHEDGTYTKTELAKDTAQAMVVKEGIA